MIGMVIRRRKASPVASAVDVPKVASSIDATLARGWRGLRAEVLGEFKSVGAVVDWGRP